MQWDDDEAPVLESLWMTCHEDLRRTGRITAVAEAIAEALRRERHLPRGDMAAPR